MYVKTTRRRGRKTEEKPRRGQLCGHQTTAEAEPEAKPKAHERGVVLGGCGGGWRGEAWERAHKKAKQEMMSTQAKRRSSLDMTQPAASHSLPRLSP